jgi:hypothetical protein
MWDGIGRLTNQTDAFTSATRSNELGVRLSIAAGFVMLLVPFGRKVTD